jgi:hypothetical protein
MVTSNIEKLEVLTVCTLFLHKLDSKAASKPLEE